MKALLIQTGAAVLGALVVAAALATLVTQVGGGVALRVLTDVAIVILALISLVMAAAWGGIYFGAAWAVGRFGGKAISGLRWVETKTLWAESRVDEGMERFVARPFASATRVTTTGSAFVRHLVSGPTERIDLSHERTGWRTWTNRMRGRAVLPPTRDEPLARHQRDVQPGPGIAA